MPWVVDRAGVERLVAEGAHLLEVLPPAEFEEEHLPGALNIPLTQLTGDATRLLDPERPVVVYCWDGL